MKKIPYFDILKKALLLTWDNKFLWFFGFLVLLGSFSSNMNFDTDKLSDQGNGFELVMKFIESFPKTFAIISILLIVLMIVFFLLKIIGVVSIVKSVNDINLYKQLKIKDILLEAKKYLGKIILLELLVSIALIVVIVVLALPTVYLFALNAKILGAFILVAAIMIMIPLFILAYFLILYAGLNIVLGNVGVRASLEMAYALFVKNMKESLLMGLISIGLGIALTIATLSLLLIAGILFAPFGLIAYLIFAKTGALAILAIAIFCTAVILIVLFSWYQSFLQTVWVFFFQEIAFEKEIETKKEEIVDVNMKISEPEIV